MARAALSGVKKLRRAAEVKFLTVEVGPQDVPQVITSTPGIPLSVACAEGVASSQRIGRDVNFTSMFFRMTVSRDASSGTKLEFVRIVIIKVKDADGIVPIWGAVGGVFESPSVLSPMNRAETNKFRVVLDKLITLSPERLTYFKKKYIRLSGKTTWDAASGTTATANANHYYLFIGTDIGGAFLPTFQLNMRMNYRDT